MKKNILIVLSVLLLFSLAGCGGEKETEPEVTTTQVNTTVVETTTFSGITEREAIDKAKYGLSFERGTLLSDKLWDEYGLIADTSQYNTKLSLATYDEATGEWKVEIWEECRANEFNTNKYLGFYSYTIVATINKVGGYSGAVVQYMVRV